MGEQIEQHAEVRAAFPSPQEGDLPLPQGLPPAMLECNPQAVEDLNAVVPQSAQQLSSQGLNEQVSFQITPHPYCTILITSSCSQCVMRKHHVTVPRF